MLVIAITSICVGRSVGLREAKRNRHGAKADAAVASKEPILAGRERRPGRVSLGYRKPAGGAGTWIAKIVVAGERVRGAARSRQR